MRSETTTVQPDKLSAEQHFGSRQRHATPRHAPAPPQCADSRPLRGDVSRKHKQRSFENMAACRLACSRGLNALYSTLGAPNQALRSCWGRVQQVRSYYVDWRMLRDVKRRQMAFDYADHRVRINALRKNTILPKELQEVADKEIAALPRDSCPVRIRNRCVMTSRPRGVKRRWRLSRIVFRHLADHNQMSGIMRAMW